MKIKLYVTKGCFGCSVMNRNLIEAIRKEHINVIPEVLDIETVSKEEKANYSDFPTLRIEYDNKDVIIFTGSTTVDAIAKLLKVNRV